MMVKDCRNIVAVRRVSRSRLNEAGFTLTEAIVGFAILAILTAVVSAVVVSGVNFMNQQRLRSNADMLCSMLTTSITDCLENAEAGSTIWVSSHADGSGRHSRVQFTSPEENAYRGPGTFRMIVDEDGIVKIAKMKSNTDFTSVFGVPRYSLIPQSSYIDGLTVACDFACAAEAGVSEEEILQNGSNAVSVHLYVYKNEDLVTEALFYVQPANAKIKGSTEKMVKESSEL